MKKIFVIGAFDRYNYGDLLFPLVIENQLKKYDENIEFEYFGLIKSDLSSVGGKPTLGIDNFYKQCKNGEQKVSVILAGGEAVAVKWDSLISAIDNNLKISIVRFLNKCLSRIFSFDSYGTRLLGLHSVFPFLILKKDFPNVNKIILNSLGGSRVNEKLFSKNNGLRESLNNADYFAVRDKVTLNNLRVNEIDAHLFPDSAILMSKFYPTNWLLNNISKEVSEFITKEQDNYIFVQVGKRISKGYHKAISENLSKIYIKDKVKICLCPIGTARAHEDHVALEKIRENLTVPYYIFHDVTIWDIMCLIASSKTYIGSSLHGAITAMSYAVPYVGLKGAKVDSYLSTWGVNGINKTFEFDSLFQGYNIAQDVSHKKLLDSRDLQFKAIQDSFDNIAEILELKQNESVK